jgi:hypothetical protein
VTVTDSPIRDADAKKTIDDMMGRIRLAPEDEALRSPKSLDDVRTILRRDAVYLFANGAAFARSTNTLDGRFLEATLELILGESQLVASQVLTMQASWVSSDLRVARARLATEKGAETTDRGRMLVQLVRLVEEGNKAADALGVVGPTHVARGAELVRALRNEAPTDARTSLLTAEYHRLRGEWNEFDAALNAAESAQAAQSSQSAPAAGRPSPAYCYLRAMEKVERYRRNDEGAAMLRECLAKNPKFIRAQAALVLIARRPREALAELAKLKAMNADHYLVAILEPTLAADQELERMESGDKANAP